MIRAAILSLALLPGAAAGQRLEALMQPGTVALMHHALAPGTGDPAGFDIADCSTQRELDARGREQARRVGQALREAGVVFDQIWASLWCRSYETAELLQMGPVVPFPPLNSFFGARQTAAAQTASVRQALAKLSADTRVLLVTHQVNIAALVGDGTRSGEIVVAHHGPDGLEVVNRVLIAP